VKNALVLCDRDCRGGLQRAMRETIYSTARLTLVVEPARVAV